MLGLTESERIKQTAAVEKDAQFQKEQIEKRQRAIAVQRAKYEKAANVSNIITSTAAGVMKASPVIPLMVLIGAIGAFQLARALAAPLPKYKSGRGAGKKETAIVGDGYVHEYIKREDGSIERTPAVPTIANLNAGDVVYKDQDDLMRAMINATMAGSSTKARPVQNDVSYDILNELKRSRHVMERMKLQINLKNDPKIETTAWYQKHIKG
jgi:hypothetical protein